ncbi:tRNA lysidine(34) synthetase TilS [Hyphobacterium sp. HN65]|uniref:tRNA(Ile)-lysidine synthase n=1 Tax=Hyphobacterium lacteum TaxID=3116575 RepID=A0ABU7LPV0_9PROT|nr:tRNA lysidine(34) synthetase TilS [Hyphobacterium sp. HN65]MEE2525913.1 tRNA lysidine(34) synthetase TilS [Hyphobacterium sp. HN65]
MPVPAPIAKRFVPVAADPPFPDPDAITACLKGQEKRTLVLGYSGGGDSHALLLIADGWAKANGATLVPVIIDHALRAESAAEAHLAADRAEALGWKSHIESWTGEKPSTGIQAAARLFRLQTFAGVAHEAGASSVLLGHTLDDQTETVWRRLRAGGKGDSLAGMSSLDPFPLWPQGKGLSLIRSLVGARRAGLRAWLEAQGEAWIEDPSNLNREYSRVRDRQLLARLEQQGFDPARLTALAQRFAGQAACEAEEAGHWLMAHAEFLSWGGVRLENNRPPLRAMDAMRAAVSGQPGRDTKAARRLSDALSRGEAATAGGAALTRDRRGALMIRDPGFVSGRADGSQTGAISVRIGTETIWDGRFSVTGEGVELRSLSSALPADIAIEFGSIPSGPARDGLAAIWKDNEFCGLCGTDPCYADARWLAPELVARNLFGDRPPEWFRTQLRDQTAQGSH